MQRSFGVTTVEGNKTYFYRWRICLGLPSPVFSTMDVFVFINVGWGVPDPQNKIWRNITSCSAEPHPQHKQPHLLEGKEVKRKAHSFCSRFLNAAQSAERQSLVELLWGFISGFQAGTRAPLLMNQKKEMSSYQQGTSRQSRSSPVKLGERATVHEHRLICSS